MYTYTLKTCDFDSNKNLKPIALFYHLQDISTRHFESVIRANEESFWVIVAWDVEIYTQSLTLENLTLKTTPTFFRKFIGNRRYEVNRENGECVAKATSKWVHVDRKSRKPSNISPDIQYQFGLSGDEKNEDQYRLVLGTLISLSSHQYFTIMPSDIDVNHHVNNVTYVRWAFDVILTLTSEDFYQKTLKRVHVRYKKEMLHGGRAKVETALYQHEAFKQVVQQIKNDRNEVCAEVITYWID